ncbi:DUF2189 domain-containing protein [Sediminicoccus sp. KRV36]|uniref:DUF2189 domain-containing protein n=1 Tax=Sediminicoccus sp. KRV36 TaxID=3133721 RepID=UPI00200F8B82|nr:DUF2189 domain-containing protein [Sediminicoccus rosea]UPY35318.1 DUF2189 domain-containing protein [Sediminicoccus rosea]
MASTWDETLGMAEAPAQIRRIGLQDLGIALRLGWADFVAAPTQIVFLCLIYPIIGFVLGSAAAGGALLPLIYPLLAGFALMGPLAALGIYEISRRREAGLSAGWTAMFGVLRSPAIFSIAALGLGLLAIFALWLMTARGLYLVTLGTAMPASPMAMLDAVMGTTRGVWLIALGNLVGAGFAVLVLALSIVSFPMLLDRNVTPGEAVRCSWVAFQTNWLVLLAWGAIVAVLLALGMALLFVGLAVVLPLLGHATWHLYRRLIA